MEIGPSSKVELVQNTIAVEKSSIIEPLQNITTTTTKVTETSSFVQLAQNTTT